MTTRRRHEPWFQNIGKNLYTVFAIVLIWRGVWYALDWSDYYILGRSHAFTALLGIIVGVILLYIPKHHLNDLR